MTKKEIYDALSGGKILIGTTGGRMTSTMTVEKVGDGYRVKFAHNVEMTIPLDYDLIRLMSEKCPLYQWRVAE